MLISLEREDDKRTANDVLNILEVAVRAYTRIGNEEIAKEIIRLNDWYDELKQKIGSDYTEADERRRRVDALLRSPVQTLQELTPQEVREVRRGQEG